MFTRSLMQSFSAISDALICAQRRVSLQLQ